MILIVNKKLKLIKKNIEISLIFLLLLITIISTTLYNSYKKIINENYKDLINNIYFQKSVSEIFDNLTPRYKNINHRNHTIEHKTTGNLQNSKKIDTRVKVLGKKKGKIEFVIVDDFNKELKKKLA